MKAHLPDALIKFTYENDFVRRKTIECSNAIRNGEWHKFRDENPDFIQIMHNLAKKYEVKFGE